MEQWFSTYSVMELEEKFVEGEPAMRDNMKGGEDGIRNNWDQAHGERWALKDNKGNKSEEHDDDLHT
jgi:hypothetical protein